MKKLLSAFTILISAFTASAQCSDLFFSEYIEGSGNNKAFEIYNPTATPIDLSDYKIYRNANGNLTPTSSTTLSGILAPTDVFVVTNSQATDANIIAESDITSGVTSYNGDDAIWLQKISTGDTIDIIGEIGVDPGSSWTVDTGSTANFTLIRKINIQQGQVNWTTGAFEWDVYMQDMSDSLGAHYMAPCNTGGCSPTFGTDIISACNSYTWIDGNTYTSSTSLPTDTLVNAAGCDSIVTLNLTVNYNTSITIFIDGCTGGTLINMGDPTNNFVAMSDTIVYDSLMTTTGCDSVVILDITINDASNIIDSVTTCDTLYTWIDGVTYTTDTTVQAMYSTVNGCDSVVTLVLTFSQLNSTLNYSGGFFTTNQPLASFQWVVCSDNYAVIPNLTDSVTSIEDFYNSGVQNGSFIGVITELNGCIDTTNCLQVLWFSIDENSPFSEVDIYPNPSDGPITINLTGLKSVDIDLFDITGKEILQVTNLSTPQYLIDENLPAGIYILTLETEGQKQTYKIVIE